MALFYSDENREPRDCYWCAGTGKNPQGMSRARARKCPVCKGTKRLGVEGAEADIEVKEFMGGWRWRPARLRAPGIDPRYGWSADQWDTEAEAVDGAREALAPKAPRTTREHRGESPS